jgi:hypothetical protein
MPCPEICRCSLPESGFLFLFLSAAPGPHQATNSHAAMQSILSLLSRTMDASGDHQCMSMPSVALFLLTVASPHSAVTQPPLDCYGYRSTLVVFSEFLVRLVVFVGTLWSPSELYLCGLFGVLGEAGCLCRDFVVTIGVVPLWSPSEFLQLCTFVVNIGVSPTSYLRAGVPFFQRSTRSSLTSVYTRRMVHPA